MLRARPAGAYALIIAALLALAGLKPLQAESTGDVTALDQQVLQLYGEGKYREAIPIAERALALTERALGTADRDTLTRVNNLGALYRVLGRYEEAERLHKRALAGFERTLGPGDPDTLTSVSNLGLLYQTQRRYSEAEFLYKRALAGFEKAFGARHPDTLTAVNNLAELYRLQGRYNEAEPLYKRALDIRERVLGKEDAKTQLSAHNLAALYRDRQRRTGAGELARRAHEGSERAQRAGQADRLAGSKNQGLPKQEQGPGDGVGQASKPGTASYEAALDRALELMAQAQKSMAAGDAGKGLELSEKAVDDAQIAAQAPQDIMAGRSQDIIFVLAQRAVYLKSYGNEAGAALLYPLIARAAEQHFPPWTDPKLFSRIRVLLKEDDAIQGELRTSVMQLADKAEAFIGQFDQYGITIDLNPLRRRFLNSFGTLNTLIYQSLKFETSVELGERLNQFAEKYGFGGTKEHAGIITTLGLAYARGLHEYDKALPLSNKALEIYTRTDEPESVNIGGSHSNLAVVLDSLRRDDEARQEFKEAIAILKKNTTEGGVYFLSQTLYDFSLFLEKHGEAQSAQQVDAEALDVAERKFGPCAPLTSKRYLDHINTLMSGAYYDQAQKVAENYSQRCQGKQPSQETFYSDGPPPGEGDVLETFAWALHEIGRADQALSIVLKLEEDWRVTHPNDIRRRAGLMRLQAVLLSDQLKFEEALEICKSTLSLLEPSPASPSRDFMIVNEYLLMGELYKENGNQSPAVLMLDLAVAGLEKLNPSSRELANAFRVRSGLRQSLGDVTGAKADIKKSIDIFIKTLRPDHPDLAVAYGDLAELLIGDGQIDEAWKYASLAEEAERKALGANHDMVASARQRLGRISAMRGDWKSAEQYYRAALQSSIGAFGNDHPGLALRYLNLGRALVAQARWDEAFDAAKKGTESYNKSAIAGEGIFSHLKKDQSELGGIVGLAFSAADSGPGALSRLEPERADLLFRLAQSGFANGTSLSVSQMTARLAASDPALAALLRDGQAKTAALSEIDLQLVKVRAQPPGNERDAAMKTLLDRSQSLKAELVPLNSRISREFPDYAELANATAISLAEAQSVVGPGEAMVMFLTFDTPGEKFEGPVMAWVITRETWRLVKLSIQGDGLGSEVQALRCGLDAAAWEGGGWQKCRSLTNAQPDRDVNGDIAAATLPFDLARAHALYQALFGQVGDLVKGKHLLLVPSGPLTLLPFQVLVTAPAASADDRSAAWLIREHALTVLPAVSSLKALRRVARQSAAAKPMIGFGNPLLDGNPASEADRQRAQEARDFKRCPETALQRVSSRFHLGGFAPVVTRGGLANVAFLRRQAPLPETAGELCAVARDVKASASDIYLGDRAREREVKRLSESGQLAQYRIVHFATHGALAGQVKGNAEPGLLLTPPDSPSEEDDGYLTASEIAALKLDADWVILSACNTAAGGSQSAEALSGLARAFIYAQARALLVSHWEVNSDASVKLITGAMSRLAADKTMGRAEAMRQSMLALIANGAPQEAHPAYWAPFVVVCEGAR